jgi:TonB family protein
MGLALLLALTVQQPDTGLILGAALAPPTIVTGPCLIYPIDLLRNGKQGLVVVEFVLDTTGHGERKSLRVVSTPHMGFNLAATAYVRDAEFTPAVFQGHKVRALIQFPVVFRVGTGP